MNGPEAEKAGFWMKACAAVSPTQKKPAVRQGLLA